VTGSLRIRPAARAVVLSPRASILLVRFEFPGGTRWALPGGGIEPGETAVEALARELREEVGLRSPSIGPHIWTREHHIRFLDGNWDGQREQIHLVRVDDEFEPTPELDWEQLRREYVHEIRWWSRDELSASAVRFVPLDLVTLIDDLVSDGPPPNAIDVRP
jgi:8-oxo-dGTP pyrophosphatase MutT (NUDIX family)